jgi:signal transduction histidine kinase
MARTIQCLHCGKALQVPPGTAGKRVRCGHCRKEFVCPDTGDTAEIPVMQPAPDLAMPRGAVDRDETLSRSMLVPMPGAGVPIPARTTDEMIGRLAPQTLRWLGISESLREFLGRPVDQLRQESFYHSLHKDDRALAEDEFRQAVEVGERHDFILRIQGKSGQWHYMRIYTQARYEPSGKLHHIRCNLKDVTDSIRAEQELRRRTEQLTAANEQLRQANAKLKDAQSQLVHSEKLAAVGTLAAGMAHEINNPLAFAANNAAVLERDVASMLQVLERYQEGVEEFRPASPARVEAIINLQDEIDVAYIQQNLIPIIKATRKGLARVAQIVQNLRDFARIDRAETGEIDVNESIEQSLVMIGEMLVRLRVEVRRDFGTLPKLEGSPAQINQVFLNLLINGMQAIEACGKSTGEVHVKTRQVGDAIVIEVADNGCGIPADVLPKIFDPFFTTKPIGRGTGLGLSLTHGIVTDHGGQISVESTPGKGTRFRIELPVKHVPAQPAKAPVT